MKRDMENIRDRAREIRLKLRLSQGEFANRMGVKQNTWSNIERGTNPCSDRYINLVCLTYNVRKEWLADGAGEMFKTNPQILPTEPVQSDDGKSLPQDALELIAIYEELVLPNKKAVLDFLEKTLQSQRNTLQAVQENKKPSDG